MKVLDIHPTCCWSLQGFDRETIERLRAAVALEDEWQRGAALQGIAGGEAFCFVGDAAKLELAREFFDEVNVAFEPDEARRVQLQQCIRRWSKQGAQSTIMSFERPKKSWRDRFLGRFSNRLRPKWST